MLILSPRFFWLVRLIVIFLVLLPAVLIAQDFRVPEEQLAHKIAAVTGPGAVFINFENRTAISQKTFDEIRSQLLIKLESAGIHLVSADQAAAIVRFSLSQDLRNYLWIAEISGGTNTPVVAMVASPGGNILDANSTSNGITLHQTLLWAQSLRILDAAVIEGSPALLLVLDTEKLATYRFQDNHWRPEQSFPLKVARPFPRDARGRIVLRRDHLADAYLPGTFCTTSTALPLTLTCTPSDDPWPLTSEQLRVNGFFTPTRNYFTGALTPNIGKETITAPFYSAALLAREKYNLGLFTAVDGNVHILDGVSDRNAGSLAWGSNVAGVHTGCGSGWQVLASRAVASPDAVTAYEIPDREPIAVGPPLEMSGQVTEMWTESAGNTAIVIVRNSGSGQYEASRIMVSCKR